ncbi:M28 family metallopeptidase [Actinomycetospora straminea]|uniref:Peptidase M28 domain-containing protein n=1 Tax=Actinomycetospora straminea TaxID=663607 RepID=A0ABP9F678_9PSEU|nr:M28 family metallopeptidase [Actinomycetospora straminea]MDD7936182.1 M28 family metallopeptidase [Actinomycetospora straminea]
MSVIGWRRRLGVVLAGAALLAAGCSGGPDRSAPAPSDPPSDPPSDTRLAEQLAATTSGDAAFVHLRALQGVADRNGGQRAAGSPGYDASVEYVAGVLRDAGFRVETPVVTVESDEGPPITTRNVVAQTTTGRTDEVVLVGAHLDSVPEGPGINDNASGSAAHLDVALALGSAPPVQNAVRFVWFGAEEDGLLGAQAYVDGLTEEQRRDIALMLNTDMIGSPNAAYLTYDGDDADRTADDPAPPGSAVIERRLKARLAAIGVPAGDVDLADDSDYGPFVDAGIPAGGVNTGDAPLKTPEQAALWGGEPGVPYDRCYHRACDTLTNIDRVAFDRMVDTIAFGVGLFAVDLGGVPDRAARDR